MVIKISNFDLTASMLVRAEVGKKSLLENILYNIRDYGQISTVSREVWRQLSRDYSTSGSLYTCQI